MCGWMEAHGPNLRPLSALAFIFLLSLSPIFPNGERPFLLISLSSSFLILSLSLSRRRPRVVFPFRLFPRPFWRGSAFPSACISA